MPIEGVPTRSTGTTTVDVRCTGHIRDAVGRAEFEYTFAGSHLRGFLEDFVAEYALEELLVIDLEADPDLLVRLWARPSGEFPGWQGTAERERSKPFSRICINGRFSDHRAGLETPLEDGDRIALLYPFLFTP